MKLSLYILLFSTFFSLIANGQTRSELEQKRQSLNKQISSTSKLLSTTTSNKKATLRKLGALKNQIGSRIELIEALAQAVDSLNQKIDNKIGVVEVLEEDLGELKENYKKLIRQLYRYQISRNVVNFLLSSNSFNQAYHRWIYLQHLEDHRSVQAKFIKYTQADLAKRINLLEAQKVEKNALLQEELQQKELLNNELKTKDRLVAELKKQEGRLRSDLKRKKRYKTALSKKIEDTILKQIAAAKAAARAYSKKQQVVTTTPNNTASNTSPVLKSFSPQSLKSQAFAKQKGKLMLPVYQGVIVGYYGTRNHPLFQDVVINNNGIDIKGQYNSVVWNVFEGEVVSIFTIPGYNNAVMIKHGDYYTTYSNIAKVYVRKGEYLKKGGQIGTIGRDANAGGHIMHFEIWHNKQKENPSAWLEK